MSQPGISSTNSSQEFAGVMPVAEGHAVQPVSEDTVPSVLEGSVVQSVTEGPVVPSVTEAPVVQSIGQGPAATGPMSASPQHQSTTEHEARIETAGKAAVLFNLLDRFADALKLDKQKVHDVAQRSISALSRFRERVLPAQPANPPLPAWNQAIAKAKPVRAIPKRAFVILFLIFFGSFCWLYLLYQLHHKDAEKSHTAILDFQPNSPPNNNRLFTAHPSEPPHAIPAQSGYPQYAGSSFVSGSVNPAMFGAPRSDMSGTGYSGAGAYMPAGYGPSQMPAQAQYGYGHPTPSGAPYGVPYGAPTSLSPVQAMAPATFSSTTELVGPRSLRHAVGAPLGYAPLANGRQRMLVNR
jgi:hypothetical protein